MTQFEEIAHSGGKITFRSRTGPDGRSWNQTYSGDRPVPMTMIAIYALGEQGIPVASANLGGPFNAPPMPGCVLVMIGSDSEGKFGHHCPACTGYWRSGPWPRLCPYCRFMDAPFQFLSDAQRRYVQHYCKVLLEFLESGIDGEFVIDMDAVADAAGQEGPKPDFYVSEESQQCRFQCSDCDEFNDVLGRFAYCSACGTRNDLAMIKSDLAAIRARVPVDNSGSIVRDAVSAFDNCVGQYCKQLLSLVPMSKRRSERLKRGRFHDIEEISEVFRWFDIDILARRRQGDIDFVQRMFLRRHVYEHNGGEADRVYIEKSKDTSVRVKQHLSETVGDLHRLLGDLDQLASLLHSGFHELIPPIEEPIMYHRDRLARNSVGRGGSETRASVTGI